MDGFQAGRVLRMDGFQAGRVLRMDVDNRQVSHKSVENQPFTLISILKVQGIPEPNPERKDRWWAAARPGKGR